MVERGERPVGGEENVPSESQSFERESLALRTRRGVPVEAFDSLDEIRHLIEVKQGTVTLAPKGRLVANQVIVRLKSAQ
jgi:coproporphyrinogen III oxidase-like Fe-S oxidoreductase